jgi:hypothetical protein
VAIVLLCTAQPADPRSDTSLAPVSDAELTLMPAVLIGAAVACGEAADDGLAWAVEAAHSNAVAETMTAAQYRTVGRLGRLMAGNSCPAAPMPRTTAAPRY